MPQRPKNFEIARVDVHADERTAPVRTGPDTAVPARFTADVQLAVPDLRVEVAISVTAGGLPVAQAVTVWASGQTPLTSGTLRKVLLDPIIRAALTAAARPARARPDIAPHAYQVEGDPEYQAWVSAPAGATERVRQVARLYTEALTAGSRSPGLDAANAVHISRAQAARYIKQARGLGLIPPLAEVTRSAPARQPVVAAIVTSALGVLVGRRVDGRPPWTFIAGEVEPGEQPEHAAEREVKEETGLEVRTGERIGERVHPSTGRTMIYMAARPVRGTDIYVGDEAELAEVRWASLAEADELLPGMFAPVLAHLTRELAPAGPHRGPGIFRDPAGPLPGTTREED